MQRRGATPPPPGPLESETGRETRFSFGLIGLLAGQTHRPQPHCRARHENLSWPACRSCAIISRAINRAPPMLPVKIGMAQTGSVYPYRNHRYRRESSEPLGPAAWICPGQDKTVLRGGCRRMSGRVHRHGVCNMGPNAPFSAFSCSTPSGQRSRTCRAACCKYEQSVRLRTESFRSCTQ